MRILRAEADRVEDRGRIDLLAELGRLLEDRRIARGRRRGVTRTGWMPACVCWRYSTSSSPRSSATATAVPSDGWPANGISSAGVQIRLR